MIGAPVNLGFDNIIDNLMVDFPDAFIGGHQYYIRECQNENNI